MSDHEPTLSQREVNGTQEATVIAPLRTSAEPHAPLESFDDYEIIEFIARGGMGVVYRARQRSLNREVALKMVLSGRFAGEEERRRFRAEAEAAARLDHPNIVPIYEVGEHEGRPFFSMRLIEGRDLADLLASEPGKRMAARDAAALVAKVARAVHYAHQRGLIHRDLKPANILIDAQGGPHITDFGLAKEIEGAAGMTLSGAVVGTPGYMAPEQAAGKVHELTTAVDVFALGAVLYHLLAGRQPFKGANAMETLRQVLETDPAPPTACGARIDPDLETICLRCLEKDPVQRFGSAESLAEDLERWLRGETILARPSTLIGRTVKWAKRRPAIAALGALAALFLILGVAGIFWQWRRADAMLALAQKNEQRAKLSRNKAEDVLDYLLGELRGKLRIKASAAVMQDVEAQVEEYYQTLGANENDIRQMILRSRAVENRGHTKTALGDVAGAEADFLAAIVFLEHALKSEPRNVEARYRRALLLRYLADVCSRKGEFKRALEQRRQALRVLEEVVLADPAKLEELCRTQAELAAAMRDCGDLAGAGAVLQGALQSVEGLRRGAPDKISLLMTAGKIHAGLSTILFSLGKDEAAQAHGDQSLHLLETAHNRDPARFNTRFDLAQALNARGLALLEYGRLNEADASLRRALALGEELTTQDPDNLVWARLLAETCRRMGDCLRLGWDWSGAENLYRRSAMIQEKFAEKSGSDAEARMNLAVSRAYLADARHAQGFAGEAAGMLEGILEEQEKLLHDQPDNTHWQLQLAYTLMFSARVMMASLQQEEAGTAIRRAIGLADMALTLAPDDRLWKDLRRPAIRMQAEMLRAQGAISQARNLYEQQEAELAGLLQERPAQAGLMHELSVVHDKIGDICKGEGEIDSAEGHYRASNLLHRELIAAAPENKSWRREETVSIIKMADIEGRRRQFAAAEAGYRHALELREKLAAEAPESVSAQIDISHACFKTSDALAALRKYPEAIALLDRAILIMETLDAQGRLTATDQDFLATYRHKQETTKTKRDAADTDRK